MDKVSRHPKFFKSKTVTCIHDVVINSPTTDPFANMLKWLGCTEKITDLKGWHNFIRRATFHLSHVGKHYGTMMMPSWNTLVLHCKRANYVMNIVHSANSATCSILNEHKHYGWKQIDDQIAINCGSVDKIFDDSQAGCGCHMVAAILIVVHAGILISSTVPLYSRLHILKITLRS